MDQYQYRCNASQMHTSGGQQVFAGEATRLAYMTEEAKEGRKAFPEKRDPDFSKLPWLSL